MFESPEETISNDRSIISTSSDDDEMMIETSRVLNGDNYAQSSIESKHSSCCGERNKKVNLFGMEFCLSGEMIVEEVTFDCMRNLSIFPHVMTSLLTPFFVFAIFCQCSRMKIWRDRFDPRYFATISKKQSFFWTKECKSIH